jgi:hypothetical protein
MPDSKLPRSWLFGPGHDEKLLGKVFDVGADRVLLDLEDAVPPHIKGRARVMVASVAAARAGCIDSEVRLTAASRQSTAHGHCTFYFDTGTGLCSYSGGTRNLTGFHATLVIGTNADGSFPQWASTGSTPANPTDTRASSNADEKPWQTVVLSATQ